MPALLLDERELTRRRQSFVVVFDPPGKVLGVALLVLLLVVVLDPWPMALVLVLVLAAILWWRWLNWRAQWVLLTDKRIIRVEGLPETTEIEAFLRVDRISGVVLVQSLPGKLLHYGTIHIEAPGDHPTLRKLEKIAEVADFYRWLRAAVFGTRRPPTDPDEQPFDQVTEPLPVLPLRAPRDRFRKGRR